MLKYLLQFVLIGIFYHLFKDEKLQLRDTLLYFSILIVALYIIDNFFIDEKFVNMDQYVEDARGTIHDNLRTELQMYSKSNKTPTPKPKSQNILMSDIKSSDFSLREVARDDDLIPYKDEQYSSEKLGREIFGDPVKLQEYVQDTRRINKAIDDNQDIYEEDDEDMKIPVYTQYGFHYMPPTKWKVPQPRPSREIWGESRQKCPVNPMYSGGSKFANLLTNSKVVPNDKFDNMYKNMVRKQKSNGKRRWRNPTWKYPSKYEKNSNYNHFY